MFTRQLIIGFILVQLVSALLMFLASYVMLDHRIDTTEKNVIQIVNGLNQYFQEQKK